MRTILAVGLISLFLIGGQAWAAPKAQYLIDSKPDQGVLIHLDEWFSTHPLKEGQASYGEQVFSSPRGTVSLFTKKDTLPVIGRHIHLTTDEIIFVYKGKGEIYINGEWMPVKAGDLHVCPRGVAHSSRTVGDSELCFISVFMPPQPNTGHDRVMIDE